MSRPPNHQQLSNSYNNNNRSGLIDFVNVPCQLGQPYDEGYHPSIYAQAGFPGYQQYNNHYNELGAQMNPYPIASPAYLPYDNGYTNGYSNTYSGNNISSSMPPVESEAVLHQRINDKIDAIIQAQKETVLNSKIESLSTKVEQLSHNLSTNLSASNAVSHHSLATESNIQSINSSDAAHIHHLSDKVQQLSQSLELLHGSNNLSSNLNSNLSSNFNNNSLTNSRSFMQSPYPSDVPVHISSEPSDMEISRRLRRLAAESSMRAAREDNAYKIPDW